MEKTKDKEIKAQRNDVIYSLIIIVFISFLVYSPSFNGEFLNWDDDEMVISNAVIKGLSFENIQIIFSTPHLNSYNPLVFLVYALAYKSFHLDPKPYHALNIFIHVINSLLVFWLIYYLSGNNLISVFTALLFSVHPVHVEAVSWVTSLKELLYTFFYLFSLISYIDYLNNDPSEQIRGSGGKLSYYITSFIFFLFAILSKPVAVTIPAALVLVNYYLKRKFELKAIIKLIPFFIVSLIFTVITILTFSKGGMVKSDYSFINNIFIFFYSLDYYLYKLVLPINLSPIYPQPGSKNEWLPVIYYISPLIIVVIAFIMYKLGKKYRELIFGSLFFLVTILPVSNLVPVKNNSLIFDRFTYLPYVGLMFAFSWFAVSIFSGKLFSSKKKSQLVFIIGILIISILSIASYKRASIWNRSNTLWNDMIEKYPDEPKGYFNMGDSYFKVKDFNRALYYYNAAIAKDSVNYNFLNDRGNAYRELKIFDKAIADYQKALSIKPDEFGVYNNMGIAYSYEQNYDSALICYRKSLEISPSYINARLNIGSYYYNLKDYDSALIVFNKALQVSDKNHVVYYNLGLTYYNKQDYYNAKQCFEQAIKLDPENELAYQKLSMTYLLNKEYDKAWENIYAMIKKKYPIDPKFLETLQKESGRKY